MVPRCAIAGCSGGPAAASNAASLTRYEGWFLIPFVALYLLAVANNKRHAILFGGLAVLGPLVWVVYNYYIYGRALEFYNGSASTLAVYRQQLAQGIVYPTDHNWGAAILYYRTAARLVIGRPLVIAGGVGAVVAVLWKRPAWRETSSRLVWSLCLLALVPLFYVWSLHSSGAALYVPGLWPGTMFNTRYAIAVLPLAALAAGSWTTLVPRRWRWGAGMVLIAAVAASWIFSSGPASICWKEAAENSEIRRVWTGEAAEFLAANYQPHAGILFTFGSDFAEVLRKAGSPLREGLHEGNGDAWVGAVTAPDLFLHEEWALATPGDAVAAAIRRAREQGLHYRLDREIAVKGAPVVDIYQRERVENPVH
jgi:hypothetical protein